MDARIAGLIWLQSHSENLSEPLPFFKNVKGATSEVARSPPCTSCLYWGDGQSGLQGIMQPEVLVCCLCFGRHKDFGPTPTLTLIQTLIGLSQKPRQQAFR